ncbi:hypothetical protein FHL15_002749 [Xylaria flabelliformis]|uniref:Uncharacterized protein n=1 Tax=Xylaria flabelliformis TaxID=2512241 RepID=A0A553I8E6_9PEZI|nr:hypothetical protein FHL15_002749 [Xylaria flabelliformis]
MKYTPAVALLPLLASAANIDARQTADLKYEISDFSAACKVDSIYCFYEISIVTSDNPEFKVSCDATGTSDNGELPAISKTQCGTYTISVAKLDDGGLVLTVGSNSGRLTGSYIISNKDLAISTSSDHTVQSYDGDTSFTIDVKSASSASTSASGTSTTTPIFTAPFSPSASPSASSVSSTAASEPSTTGSTTSSSPSPSKTNGAARESAFAGAMFAVGVMAFMF